MVLGRGTGDVNASRRPRMSIALGLLAMPCWLACSLQNFGDLTDGLNAVDSGGSTVQSNPSSSSSSSSTFSSSSSASTGVTVGDEPSGVGDTGDATADSSMPHGDGSAPVADGSDGAPSPFNYLVNPNFAGSTLNGWTVVPAADNQVYVFTQAPIGSGYTPQGQEYELATYTASTSFTADVSQTPASLPDGLYTFSAWFNCGANNQAYIYANCSGAGRGTDGGPDSGLDGGSTLIANIPITSSTGWEQISISGIEVRAGSCQVGFYVDASATDWLNADGFMLELDTPFNGDAGDAAAD